MNCVPVERLSLVGSRVEDNELCPLRLRGFIA